MARCYLLFKEAMRDPESEKMDLALQRHREVMRQLPAQDVYRLAEQYADLVLEKVRPPDVERERKLLEETVALIEREQRLRPECPGLYYRLYLLYKLLGDREQTERYQKLHEQKKKEWEHKEQYDHRGRPRCR